MRPTLLALLLACGGPVEPAPDKGAESDADADADSDADTDLGGYAFTGRTGESSVVYEGQVFRHLLRLPLEFPQGVTTWRLSLREAGLAQTWLTGVN